MDLQSLTKQLIYDEHNIETPDIYQKFGIVCPEYSSRDIEVKEYPRQGAFIYSAMGYT